MKLILMGYMGVGKTTIAKQLAKLINLEFKDLDEIISKNEGLQIPEIFASKGELFFRKRESEYLKNEILNNSNFILSLGGGTPCYGSNLEFLLNQKEVVLVYLQASIKTLAERLFIEKAQRPLISHIKTMDHLIEFIGKHLFERNQYYQKANCIINIDQKSVDEILNEILKLLSSKLH